MTKTSSLIIVLPMILGGLSACVPSSQTGTDYSRSEARQVQQIKIGRVLEVNLVNIEGTKTGLGGAAGGAAGGIAAGSAIGSGSGSDVAAIGGAVVGAVVGAMAEEQLTREQGHEYTIRLENGNVISVVQAHDPDNPDNIFPGDEVKLLIQQSTYRVVKLQNSGAYH